MVKISSFASGVGLTAVVSGLPIIGPDSNGVKVAIGFDKKLVSSNAIVANVATPAKMINYDTAVLLKMGKLEAEASNHTEPALHGRTVFGGKDEREAWTDSSFPYRSIGRLASSGGYVCTGTLIGPRHIITARHCTPTSSGETLRFQPFYYNGETRFTGSQVTTYITSTSRDGECLYGQDWAIHILADRLGDKLGYFGSRAMTKDYLNRGIFYNFGYAGDLPTGLDRPVRSAGGTMQQFGTCADGDNPTLGNVDVSGGQSGGPIWDYSGSGDRMLMGTLYGSSSTNSVWASGQAMVNAILQSRKDFP